MNINRKSWRQLRIAIVVENFPSVSETFIVNQIADLIDRGHNVQIFSFHQGDTEILHQKIIDYRLLEKTTYYEDIYLSGIKRYRPFQKLLVREHKNVNFARIMRNFNFFKNGINAFNLRFFYKSKWFLDAGKFDICHAHFGRNGAYLAELKTAGFLAQSKLLTSFHGYDLTPAFLPHHKQQYKQLFKEVDILTVNTMYTLSLLKEITSKTKIEILPVGLDTSEFKPQQEKSKNFKILYVGRLIALKGALQALRVLQILLEKGYKDIDLTLVGEGEQRKEIEEYIKDHKLQSHVKLLGAQSQEMVKELMRQSHVFFLPGIYDDNGRAETQGLVIQEAQAMELPVLVSDVGGMKYGVLEGETGFVVPEKDIAAFAEKLEFLIHNPDIRSKMGKKGREFVVENYDSKILGNRLEAIYCDILQN
ncbi:MAG: glycosyltransferase [Gillisia sp.]